MKFMMQDCIMAAGEICTAGSKMLRGFRAPFSAAVFERCESAGMEFAGLIPSDEFGIDGLFDQSDAVDASVTAVLEDKCDAVLCNDVFGKLRRQAASNGLIYIRPVYGTVSRFGLIPAVSSMDQVGVLCRSLEDGLAVLSAISGHDSRDGTSLPQEAYSYNADNTRAVTVGLADHPAVTINQTDHIKTANAELKYFGVMPQVLYILGAAEISNNTTRYDGVKFGFRAEDARGLEDVYLRSRSEGFGQDAKLASVVGCMVLSKEHYEPLYHKSMQIRRLIKEYYDGLLEKFDVIALPANLGGNDKYAQSALYALPLLCGYASVALPHNDSGVQFICKRGNENAMFSLAREVLT
ncbi:MAG: amidase family protein [Oscillospiraceae bacterium]|nr:amidase family protein [Oscillospiraceae bacterium]